MTKSDLYFALRCGLVKTRLQQTAIGRVTLLNWDHDVVMDVFVKVPQQVQDYCTAQTGITAAALESPHAISFDKARKMIQKKIVGKILVGHGLEVDLAALGLSHPWCDIRDAATYAPFMMRSSSQLLLPQDLGDLAATVLQRENIMGCPQREAMACLDLYKETRREWEADLIRIAQEKSSGEKWL